MEDQIMNNVEEVTPVVEEVVKNLPVKSNSGWFKKGLIVGLGVGATVGAVKLCKKVIPAVERWSNERAAKKLVRAGYEVFTPADLNAVDNVLEPDSID